MQITIKCGKTLSGSYSMVEIEDLEKRLTQIEERNKKVELDKKWETSLTRKFCIALFTYFSIALYMAAININDAWRNAIVPTLGFLLSTLTLPAIKNFWDNHIYNKKRFSS